MDGCLDHGNKSIFFPFKAQGNLYANWGSVSSSKMIKFRTVNYGNCDYVNHNINISIPCDSQ